LKNTVLLFALFSLLLYAGEPPADKARGIFLTFGVGPKTPVGTFAKTSMIGYGVNAELDYTDNEYLPIFLFSKIEFLHFPGSQDLYQTSDYSHYSTNFLPFSFGGRYYFAPFLKNFVIVMPFVEASGHFAIFQRLQEYKVSTALPGKLEDGTKFGFSVGVGASMFLMEVLASYTYFTSNQYIGLDLKIRLPMYVSI
jgi:opacity protein-like surface antigen